MASAAARFIHDDFLLLSSSARELYHGYAAFEPIFDYHCHLPPRDIAENRMFRDLFEVWLEGDHYKWRAMRSNGEPERFCTGNASAREKFDAWARTVPYTLRNPLYHWTHLELKRYLDWDGYLSPATADEVWHRGLEKLSSPEMGVHGLLNRHGVRVVCTTDDPIDTLEWHRALQREPGLLQTRVYPAFRPDKALAINKPGIWPAWVKRLSEVSDTHITDLPSFLDALRKRHDFFHQTGGRLSDHGMNYCLSDPATEAQARALFEKALGGGSIGQEDADRFGAFLMIYFGHLDAEKGWTKQLHLGAMRNNSTRHFDALGPDTGFDSIGDWPQAEALSRYLDHLDRTNQLPRTILYNLNPVDNYVFATMIGNFQDGSIAGKIQFGSGWWFNDQLDGMTAQINALSNCGLLSRFVGMLTDSRSFFSFPRHEYFRRLLCQLIGQDVENGLLPRDIPMLGEMVRNICYRNACNYFGLAVDALNSETAS